MNMRIKPNQKICDNCRKKKTPTYPFCEEEKEEIVDNIFLPPDLAKLQIDENAKIIGFTPLKTVKETNRVISRENIMKLVLLTKKC